MHSALPLKEVPACQVQVVLQLQQNNAHQKRQDETSAAGTCTLQRAR